MGKVKELMMTIQEAAWNALEKNPNAKFDELNKEVAVATNYSEAFIAPIVEDVFLEYKREAMGDENEGYEGYGVEDAKYDES